MQTVQLTALTSEEVSACFALHMAYCRDNPDATDWQQHHDRALEFARMLPDTPLETQIKLYEAA